jgi:hypothetical protein
MLKVLYRPVQRGAKLLFESRSQINDNQNETSYSRYKVALCANLHVKIYMAFIHTRK